MVEEEKAQRPLDAALERALNLQRDGQLAEAEAVYRQVLSVEDRNFDALLHLGALRLQQSRPLEALTLTEVALMENSASAEAHSNLGAILLVLQRLEDSVAAFEAALLLEPEYAEAHYGLGAALQRQGRIDEAAACFRRALTIEPEYVEALCALAVSLQAQKSTDEAIDCYEKAIAIDPDFAAALAGLGMALQEKSLFEEAIIYFERALALDSDNVELLNNLGLAQQAVSQYTSALASFERASSIGAPSLEVLLNHGFALQELGKFAEARHVFEKAVALQPSNPLAYFALVNCQRVKPDDPYLPILESLTLETDKLDQNKRVYLEFAITKAYADLGRNDESFRHVLSGNRLQRELIDYDERLSLETLNHIPEYFSAKVLREKSGFGSSSELPIFVVGMPRSGSTLVEQILASHPEVCAVGERDDFIQAMTRSGFEGRAQRFPSSIASATAEQIRALGQLYLSTISQAAQDELNLRTARSQSAPRRIVDKTLIHFVNLGLIALTLPKSKVIHVRRDPVDTCLSCFSKLFSNDQFYAYDLGELGRYYAAYAHVMAHWRNVLPPGLMLEIDYHELVEDFEGQTRKILAHCGLKWDQACLNFHDTQRPIRTASGTQVRSPLFRSGLQPWRPDDTILQPLLEGLGIAAEDRPWQIQRADAGVS